MKTKPKRSPWFSATRDMRNRKPLAITLSDEARTKLDKAAESSGRSRSAIVEALILGGALLLAACGGAPTSVPEQHHQEATEAPPDAGTDAADDAPLEADTATAPTLDASPDVATACAGFRHVTTAEGACVLVGAGSLRIGACDAPTLTVTSCFTVLLSGSGVYVSDGATVTVGSGVSDCNLRGCP
jgi:hypothetical protein